MTTAYFAARPIAQEQLPDVAAHLRNIAEVTNRTTAGQDNSSFALTLDGGTTTVMDPRISRQTCLCLMPTSAAAAAALPSIWITCSKGQAVVNGGSAGLTYTAHMAG